MTTFNSIKNHINNRYHDIVILFLIIFPAMAYGAVETWSLTILYIVVIFALTITIIKGIRKGKVIHYSSPIDAFILLFFTLEIFSVFFSVYPYISQISLYKSISYIIVFYYVINNLRARKQLFTIVWILVVFGSLYATVAISFLSDDFLGFKNFSNNEYITLTFVNRNHFAGYLEMIVWLAIGLAFINKGSKRILLLFLATYIASAIFFSLSRGGSIGFIASIFFISFVMFFMEKKKTHLLLIGGFILLIILTIIMIGIDPLITRLETLQNPELAGKGRLEYWAGTYKMILDNFWFGTGLGTYSSANAEYKTIYRGDHASKAGNFWSFDPDFAAQFTRTGQHKELKDSLIEQEELRKQNVKTKK